LHNRAGIGTAHIPGLFSWQSFTDEQSGMDRLSGILLNISRLFINRPRFVYAQNIAQPKSKGHPEGWPVQKKAHPEGGRMCGGMPL